MDIVIIETLSFTRRVTEFLSDDEYTALQWFICNQPTAGDVIPRTGGARKMRWKQKGQGKRGGLRVIYFHHSGEEELWMLAPSRRASLLTSCNVLPANPSHVNIGSSVTLALYAKSEQEDLSTTDKKILKRLIEKIKK